MRMNYYYATHDATPFAAAASSEAAHSAGSKEAVCNAAPNEEAAYTLVRCAAAPTAAAAYIVVRFWARAYNAAQAASASRPAGADPVAACCFRRICQLNRCPGSRSLNASCGQSWMGSAASHRDRRCVRASGPGLCFRSAVDRRDRLSGDRCPDFVRCWGTSASSHCRCHGVNQECRHCGEHGPDRSTGAPAASSGLSDRRCRCHLWIFPEDRICSSPDRRACCPARSCCYCPWERC